MRRVAISVASNIVEETARSSEEGSGRFDAVARRPPGEGDALTILCSDPDRPPLFEGSLPSSHVDTEAALLSGLIGYKEGPLVVIK